ncbi:hypothetical protein IU500_13365 [Nocardia terpenica]|uniref:hypothetical protein n=1 Tax=Nocardia terpenica TaxID=455432 RepID=UPI001893AF9A|nr:hypothetical protein [Nocardia terpenica]MBF6105031.1 hypothetical protein [Nocardia terpenica]MBF6112532.1 hypothetical protein [Nocardia terpenica]MBF6118759.1 hypothetical protein [Nocardia terpenica]MBF6154228.1 hypothetical protein [Nocardia terpenica]
MPRDTRPYIKLTLDFLENPKTAPLSPVAKLKLIETWIFCARNRTDGVLLAVQARKLIPLRIRQIFDQAQVWHHVSCTTIAPCGIGVCTASVPCGQESYRMHDYDAHQTLYTSTRTRTDARGYIRVALDFLENHKTGPMTPVAKLKLIELWIFCARNRTDGVITTGQARRIVPARIRDVFTTARSWHHHDCTTHAPCGHGGCTMSAPCLRGVFVMHDYSAHQTTTGRSEKAQAAGRLGGLAKAARTRRIASISATNARAVHKSQVINTSLTRGFNPAESAARKRDSPPPVRLAARRRHGGDEVADRLNAAAPEIPVNPAMRQRVLARLVPDAVSVLADPEVGAARRARAQAELDRAGAVIDARAEYLATGDLAENPDMDRLFDQHGGRGYTRRMAAAQTPLPTPDPVTAGEARALAYRLARDHVDTVTRQGGTPPGSAREALRAEIEALLSEGIHQDVLRAELGAMREAGLWAASKLRARIRGSAA